MEWKKIFANHIFDNGLISRIYKEILQLNSNNKIQFKNEQSTWIDITTNTDSVLKSKNITWLTKVHRVKVMVFPVVMCGCESWTIKKAERWRIDTFELWCWRRPLRVPWKARRSNQSILKEINPKYSLEGLMPKLKI